MKIRHLFTLLLGFLFVGQLIAQRDFTIYNMRYVPQSVYLNPAFIPKSKVNIGLPGMSSILVDVSNSGFRYKDLFLEKGTHIEFSPENMLQVLDKRNYLKANVNVDLLHFGMRYKEKNYFTFSATEKVFLRFIYPEDLLRLAWEGNGETFIGTRANMDDLGVDFMHYREFAIGVSREVNEQLTTGAKLKLLKGLSNVYTKTSELGLTTNADNFELTADGKLELFTSGINEIVDEGDDTTQTLGFEDYITGKNNTGFGLDLGGVYKLNEQIEVSGSLLDLGFISWKHDVKKFTNDGAEFTFKGIDINDFLKEDTDSTNTSLEQAEEDLEAAFELDESTDKYSTFLPSRIMLGGNYKINEKHNAGVVLQSAFEKGRIRPAIALSYNAKLLRWLGTSVTYSMYNKSYFNVGAGLSVNVWPVQFYIVSDQILAPLMPDATKNVHVHTGINLTFGRKDKDADKDGIPDKKDDCPEDAGDKENNGCPDTDKDGLIDKNDDCPKEAGSADLKGCPDKDGDKVADKDDECPDVPGSPEHKGCPDRDEDGIADKNDDCPDEKGLKEFNGCPDRDGDGIMDKEDDCPEEKGLKEHNGCPDTDADGIRNDQDDCPDMAGVKAFNGCPDKDGDGVRDIDDKCPDEVGPKENNGCPYKDSDGDGLLDNDDKCPNAIGPKENNGCPHDDADGDGVIDKEDNCPEIPGLVMFKGCPDSDNDGVQNSEDECPEIAGVAAFNGCPDTDGDGIRDRDDKCPEEAGSKENEGCPLKDRDNDGVLDKDDDCPDVAGPKDNKGCPFGDIDNDGVIDKDDRCPKTPGTAANNGCPEIEKEEQEVLKTAFDNLEFESGKAVIKASSYQSLDKLAELLEKKPSWKLKISGHTDNVGDDNANMKLSEDRAKAVAKYLQNRGIAPSRLITEWFGETKPLYPNDTPEGRQKNRRVEMEVVFE